MPMNHCRHLITLLLAAFAFCGAMSQTAHELPTSALEAQRLPSLHMARKGHYATCTTGGQLVVFGGHTTGFVPTPTAERYDGREWHLMQMTYTHDQGLALPLSSGRVLLAGGHQQPLGIGQTFTVETYDPQSQSFSGYGCLDLKRCFGAAAELDSGRVVISGTWYAPDGLEMWQGTSANRTLKPTSLNRSAPYVMRTAAADAIVFGVMDEKGNQLERCYVVDRLGGEAYEEPFLKQYHPLSNLVDQRSEVSFVGDTAAQRYDYIICVADDREQLHLAHVQRGKFSLLRSDHAIPLEYQGHPITWYSRFIADRSLKVGYIVGHDDAQRFYVLRVDYAVAIDKPQGVARLSLAVSQPLPEAGRMSAPVLTADGNLVIAGGTTTNNFEPTDAVYCLAMQATPAAAMAGTGTAWMIWGAAGLAAAIALWLLIYYIVRRRGACCKPSVSKFERTADTAGRGDDTFATLLEYAKSGQHFLRQDLRLADVASVLGTTDRQLSACLHEHGYRSFPDFLNALRIDYACALMRREPDIKVSALSMAAGFTSESAFYSAFSKHKGTTPKQWLAQQGNDES